MIQTKKLVIGITKDTCILTLHYSVKLFSNFDKDIFDFSKRITINKKKKLVV